MKHCCTAALLLAIAGAATGATVTGVSQKLNLTQSEGCNDIACTTSFKAKANFAMQFDMTPSETSALGADTLVEMSGVDMDHRFRIGDAVGYTPGDTKVTYTTTTLTRGLSVYWKLTMDWTGGKGKATMNASGKESIATPHPAIESLSLASNGKSHSPAPLYVSVEASNDGTTVLDAQARVKADVVTNQQVRQTANDEVTITESATVKVKLFQDLSTVP